MSAEQAVRNAGASRRQELLAIAARLFAEKGFRNTTVRDIADAAGILSGSLYHHFDSKESMVDEILSTFQEELFGQYDAILAGDQDPLAKVEQAVLVSFDAIDKHRDEVAIYQNDAAYLLTFDRFAYLGERNQQSRAVWLALLQNGIDAGVLRDDLDLELTYRFIRDTIWVAVSWYRPGGRRTTPRSPSSTSRSSWKGFTMRSMSPRPSSSTPSGHRSASGAARSPAVHSADLAAHSISALMTRTGVDPGAVDDVILGCCDTIGSQAGDVARTAWLVAGLPDHVPGVTIDRQCGSSQQAVHFAAQGVMSGTQDLVVAGGVQNMSAIPISAAMLVGQQYGFSTPFAESPGWVGPLRRPGGQPVPLGRDDRREVGHLPRGHGGVRARLSRAGAHRNRRGPVQERDRADRAPRRTELRHRPVPARDVPGEDGRPRAAGSRRPDHRRRRLADLRRLVGDADRLRAGRGRPRAHPAGPDPPPLGDRRRPGLDAHRPDPGDPARAASKSGLSVDDIDLFECNEAFASVALAWMKECGVPHEKVNVNGGGIALGHPIGATGTRIMATLLNELERTGGRYGLQTMCEGGGQANVTIIERL